MNIIAHNNKINTTVVLPLLEPVPIYREEVRWGHPCEDGDAVYSACAILGINPDASINNENTKPPTTNTANTIENSVTIYPNPANNKLYVEFKKSLDESAIVEIFDINGKLCYKTNINILVNKQSVDLNSMNKGIYYIRITTTNFTENQKLVIIK